MLVGFLSIWGGCQRSGFTPTHVFPDAASLLAHHEGPRRALSSIQAEARVDQRGNQGRVRGTVLMFVERVGHVRFDVMTQFGPVLTLTSDGQRFALADMRDKTFTTGPACPSNIARLLGMPVSATQAAGLLLGGAPELAASTTAGSDAGSQTHQIEWKPEPGSYLITRKVGKLIAQMELSLRPEDRAVPLAGQRFRLSRSSLESASGHVFWRAEYNDYREVQQADGTRFEVPFHLRVVQPATETDTLVRFQEVIPNPEIPGGAFAQRTPAGVATVESPCE